VPHHGLFTVSMTFVIAARAVRSHPRERRRGDVEHITPRHCVAIAASIVAAHAPHSATLRARLAPQRTHVSGQKAHKPIHSRRRRRHNATTRRRLGRLWTTTTT
jgi:hypothetical protein